MKIPTPESTPLTIEKPDYARTSYMLSKILGESLLACSGLNYTTVRFHNVYGPRMGLSHVVPELLKKAYELKEGEKLPVYSPKHTRAFCYIDDATVMLQKIIEAQNCANDTYNIGNEADEISIESLAWAVLQTVGKDNPLQYMPDTVGSPVRRAPAMDKLFSTIGNVQMTSIEEGLQRTFDWYHDNVFISSGISAK